MALFLNLSVKIFTPESWHCILDYLASCYRPLTVITPWYQTLTKLFIDSLTIELLYVKLRTFRLSFSNHGETFTDHSVLSKNLCQRDLKIFQKPFKIFPISCRAVAVYHRYLVQNSRTFLDFAVIIKCFAKVQSKLNNLKHFWSHVNLAEFLLLRLNFKNSFATITHKLYRARVQWGRV